MRRTVKVIQTIVYCVRLCPPMSFSFRSLRFNPSLVPTVAALAAVALTGYLGHWQQQRAAEKSALQREFDARDQLSPVLLDALTRDPDMLLKGKAKVRQ